MPSTTKVPIPSLSALYLRPATEAEKGLCFARSYPSWGRPLNDISEYLERERINGLADVNRNGHIIYWVLSRQPTSPAPGEEVDDDIVAACETLRRPVVFWTREGGYVEGLHGYGIASVFTHPKYRGQGAATVLLQKLIDWFDDDARGNAPFTALFSDLGKEFYAQRGGWHPYSSRQLVLKVSSQPEDAAPALGQLSECQPLQRQDLQALCNLDVKMLKQSYRDQKQTDLPEDKSTRATFLPTFAQACWHFGTEEFVAKVVRGKIPLVRGSVVPNAQNPHCWLYWVHDVKDNQLVVLRLVIKEDGKYDKNDVRKDLAGLLYAATVEAREWNFTQVVVWNPPEALIHAAELLKPNDVEKYDVFSRESDSIPCLRWRRGEKSKDEIAWDPNEKFEWC